MKKLLTMMLIIALSVSCLAGCGSSKITETETTSKKETQQTEETSTEVSEPEKEETSKAFSINLTNIAPIAQTLRKGINILQIL